MTTHVAAWIPGASNEAGRLYWASDRRTGMADGFNAGRFYKPQPKSIETASLWAAGSGMGWCVLGGRREAASSADVWEFCGKLEGLASDQNWPERDMRPDWLVCDEAGLYVVTPREVFSVRPGSPVAIGSGREYAIGACLALLPAIPTARTDWAAIVRRAVLVAGECDEGTEGVESGVWRPGPTVYRLEAEDVAVPA